MAAGNLAVDLGSQIAQRGTDIFELRVGIAVMSTQIRLALNQLCLLATQQLDRRRSDDLGNAVASLAATAEADACRPLLALREIGLRAD
jgi:hypothetical protein